MHHVVMFSGGVASWAAAKRVVERHGKDNTTLLFTDTKIEDEDLYRFLNEASENVGAELVRIADGRTPFQVFADVKMMGNTRVDPCSRILKRELADKWIASKFTPETVTVHVGIDMGEYDRYERMAKRKLPWVYDAPLCWKPQIMKGEIFAWLDKEGIHRPRLYNYGLFHNNCAGFCIKAGQAHYRKLWINDPERYRQFERMELDTYEKIGKKNPFLRVTDNGKLNYITLREFREEWLEKEGIGKQCDLFDDGGCGCFTDWKEDNSA